MLRFAPISLAALVALGFAANAGGLDNMRTARVVVAVNDLNLDRPADARVAFHRIERAANAACGGNPLARTWHGQPIAPVMRQYNLCREEAIARTVAQLQLPRLMASYVEKHNHPTDRWADEFQRR